MGYFFGQHNSSNYFALTEKRQLKKTSHFHHSDEGETSFFMKLVFLPVIAFRGRGITADVFAVDEAVSLYFIVV